MPFAYYGAKHGLARGHRAKHPYPRPHHQLVVEPFAGSAGYTCHHLPSDALLNDADRLVVDTWHRLQTMTRADLDALDLTLAGDRSTEPILNSLAGSNGWTDRSQAVTSRMRTTGTPTFANEWRAPSIPAERGRSRTATTGTYRTSRQHGSSTRRIRVTRRRRARSTSTEPTPSITPNSRSGADPAAVR